MKIVINKCYGGYNLSELACFALAERKGLTLYPEGKGLFVTYWTVPESERPAKLNYGEWYNQPEELRKAYNEAYRTSTFSTCPEDRTDPDLIAVVEELGAKASGRFAQLVIIEIPDDVEWEIEEYDGIEWVSEVHRTWS